MSKITLVDGSSVDVTNTHMVPILTENDSFTEVRADQLKKGDRLASVAASGSTKV